MKLRPFLPLVVLTLMVPLGTVIAQAQAGPELTPGESSTGAPQVIAQRPDFDGDRHRGRRGGRMRRIFEQLDLTPEQTQRIRDVRQQSRQSTQDLRQQIQAAHDQMRSLMASNASSDQLRQQHQRIQALRQQMANQRFEMLLLVREELTPAQRTKLAELGPKFGKHRGRFGR